MTLYCVLTNGDSIRLSNFTQDCNGLYQEGSIKVDGIVYYIGDNGRFYNSNNIVSFKVGV